MIAFAAAAARMPRDSGAGYVIGLALATSKGFALLP